LRRVTDRLLGAVRIGFAALTVAALAFMIATLIDEGVFSPLNFFTFFTVLSNLFAAAIFAEGGRRQLTGAPPIPDPWRGAAVVYMSVTFIVPGSKAPHRSIGRFAREGVGGRRLADLSVVHEHEGCAPARPRLAVYR
jgi:hypothetical protein